MDIVKELREFKSDKNCLDKHIDEVAVQQEELAKKSHLLKVIGVSSLIEQSVSEDFCRNAELKNIKISLENQYDEKTRDYEYRLLLTLVDSEHKLIPISAIPEDSKRLQQFFHALTHTIKDLQLDFYNEDLQKNKKYYLELKLGIGEQVLELLLCEELRKIYEYSNMQLDLDNNENSNRRLKI